MSTEYDVIVIGAGPAGYVAAIRCAQNGLKTACIDNWINAEGKPSPGGTCLNVGCIPSKALLESSEQYARLRHHGDDHGLIVDALRFDIGKMMQRKNRIVGELTGGILALLKGNKVDFIVGAGRLLDGARHSVEVTPPDGGAAATL